MTEDLTTIFTDGSSRGNPGPGGYGYIAIYQDAAGEMQVKEGGGEEDPTTNNRMELMAVIKALESCDRKKIKVYLDAAYVLNGITKWVFGWEKNGWKTSQKEPVSNEDLWKRLMAAVAGKKIEWELLKGHAGIAGNERCDEIATGRAKELFKGKLRDYHFDPFDIKSSGATASSKKNKGKAYSYVSAVNGIVMVHKTWEACEKRVKGAKGARFKKALSPAEERDLMNSLGNL